MKEVFLFTDGSCLNNPGPGGYGAILRYGSHEKELAAGFKLTTNNRMELKAVIAGLSAIREPCRVTVVTDSQYVKNGITSWLPVWIKRQWRTKQGGAVKNQDLWQQLNRQCLRHEVAWQWVKGHAGHQENERCDKLARNAAANPAPDALNEDQGYRDSAEDK